MWYCRLKRSSGFSDPTEFYHRLDDLESEMVEAR